MSKAHKTPRKAQGSLPMAVPQKADIARGPLRMRLGAGKYAVCGGEIEIRADGARIAGGTGCVEFDLFAETWIEIVILR